MAAALLTSAGASADPLRRITDGPLAEVPPGTLASGLGCAGALFAVFEHYSHGASDLSDGHGRDALERMMMAFRKDAIRAFYAENELSIEEGGVSVPASGVIANGVYSDRSS